ncbi:MAG TPA: hypothetical protein VFV72_14705 [Candidatus Limnocylindrales bacterium]|nr:hypothetical protein [Candidatus Limnocylindrales bacterium]
MQRTRSELEGPVRRHARRNGGVTRRRSATGRVPDETLPSPPAGHHDAAVERDTVIVATTAGGETLTSSPMPRIQAEMLLVLGVRGGTGRVRPTGIVRAALRDVQ